MEHVINANAVASRFLQRTSSSPTAFTGDSQSWQKWHSEFKEFARGLAEWLVNTMEVTELLTEDTEMQSLGELFPEPASVLMAILDRLLLGTAANIIQHAKLRKNGFEAWRCLCYEYQRSDRRGSKSLRRTILDFDFSGDLVDKLDQWETLISVYNRLDPTTQLDDTARAIILEKNTSMEIPADVLKSTDVVSYDRLKEFLLSQDHHRRPVLVHTGPGEPQQGTSAVSRVSDSDIAAPAIDLLHEEDERLHKRPRWLPTDKGILNVYFICRSGRPCNIVTQPKAWTFQIVQPFEQDGTATIVVPSTKLIGGSSLRYSTTECHITVWPTFHPPICSASTDYWTRKKSSALRIPRSCTRPSTTWCPWQRMPSLLLINRMEYGRSIQILHNSWKSAPGSIGTTF